MRFKLRFLLFLLLFSPLAALAQFTTITATITDQSGNPYANCSYNIDFVNNTGIPQLPLLAGAPFQTSYGGSCSSTATMTARIPDTAVISPAGTQWKFSISDQTGKVSFSYTAPACPTAGCITGTTIDISTALKAVAAPLGSPILPGSVGGSLTPAVTNAYNLGSPSAIWANGYFTNLPGNMTLSGNDTATGSWLFSGANISPFTISTATESGSTVTITTSVPCPFIAGQIVDVFGVGNNTPANNRYNGTWQVATSCNGGSSFTYVDPANSALASTTGGSVSLAPIANTAGPGAIAVVNPGKFDNLNMYSYMQSIVGGCNPTTEVGWTQQATPKYDTDAILGCIMDSGSSTQYQVSAGTFLANTKTPNGNLVGIFAQAQTSVSAGNIWGGNIVVNDLAGTTSANMEGLEIDVDVNGPPSGVYALQLTGTSSVSLPVNSAVISMGPLGTFPYNTGIIMGDNTALTAMTIGIQGTGASRNSMPINFVANNSGSVHVVTSLSSDPFNDLIVNGGNGGIIVGTYRLGTGTVLISSTAPTIAGAGCGGSAAAISGIPNGTAAFKINVGLTPTSACTITMPGATTGWNCFATDTTTNSTSVFLQKQTGAESTTGVTITNFNDVAVATPFVASDILKVSCHAD